MMKWMMFEQSWFNNLFLYTYTSLWRIYDIANLSYETRS